MRLLKSALLLALMLGGGPLWAAQLDEATCNGLKAERETLAAQGVKADIDRGPEWGKSNLAPDRLKQIARWIEVEEQLLFRCPRAKIAIGKEPPKSDATGKATDEADEDGKEPGGKDATGKDATGKGKLDAAVAPPSPGAEQPAPRPSTKKKRAAAKPKTSDAYVPPQPSANAATQPLAP